jgi:DNA-binding CsgD family transcriptional regulator
VGGQEKVQKVYLIIVNVSPNEWSAVFSGKKQVLGRSSQADISIDRRFKSISRRHVRIWTDDREIWVEDLGSSFGTRVNGVAISNESPVSLEVGDRLTLGQVEFQVIDHKRYEDLISAEIRNSESSIMGVARKPKGAPTHPERDDLPPEFSVLTQAELEIVIWLSRGVMTEEGIAEKTGRSPRTVHTHLNNIHRKLNVHSRHELISLFLRPETGL